MPQCVGLDIRLHMLVVFVSPEALIFDVFLFHELAIAKSAARYNKVGTVTAVPSRQAYLMETAV